MATMTTSLRTAQCLQCAWKASGSTSWAQGAAHTTETGHQVRTTGSGDGTVRPNPYTQPLEDPSGAQ